MKTPSFRHHLRTARRAAVASTMARVFAEVASDQGDHHEAARLRRRAEDADRERARAIGRLCDAVA